MTDTHISPDAVIAAALTPDDLPDLAGHPDEQPWRIDGRRTAEWAIAKVRAAHDAYAEATAPARDAIEVLEARIAELREFIDGEGRRRDHTADFFEAHLKDWARRERQVEIAAGRDPDKAMKSVKLAGGTVASRAAQDRVEVTAPDVLAVWVAEEALEGAEHIVRMIPKVDHTVLKAYIAETGERPPGVTVTQATEDDRKWTVNLT